MTYLQAYQNIKKILSERQSLVDSQNDYTKFRNLKFYNWDKPKDQQQDTFVGLVGLPVKNAVEHGLYDYEQDIFNYLERNEPTDPKNRHLAIIKSAGLGITSMLLLYIGYKCTVNNDFSGKRIGILTAPRLELTMDLITRLKRIFTNNDLLKFDDKNTVCTINNCIIQAFPSNLGIRSLRGYSDLVMIACDEASWFNINQNQEVSSP